MAKRGSKTVGATVNSFQVLEQLVAADRPLGVTELSDSVGLSKGVVHNHLSTLSELGYVRKHDRKYLPSLALLALGERARRNVRPFDAARFRVDNLARTTGEVSTLFVEEDGVAIPTYLALGSDSWSPNYCCGQRIPLHATAPGKAILSSLEPASVTSFLGDQELVALTTETLTEPDSLVDELRNVRESGIAFCRGEHSLGVVGVAAPIGLDERGPAAAIGLCGPRERLTGRYLEEDITGQVISAAKSVQVELTK